MKATTIVSLLALAASSFNVFSEDMALESSSTKAEVYFIQPSDGQAVHERFKVVFGLKNMEIVPAGTKKENSGHHHLLIDTDVLPDLTKPLPVTDKLKHFGQGETEAEITLPPGEHTLQLIVGDYAHVPHHNPVISKKISVTVE